MRGTMKTLVLTVVVALVAVASGRGVEKMETGAGFELEIRNQCIPNWNACFIKDLGVLGVLGDVSIVPLLTVENV